MKRKVVGVKKQNINKDAGRPSIMIVSFATMSRLITSQDISSGIIPQLALTENASEKESRTVLTNCQ